MKEQNHVKKEGRKEAEKHSEPAIKFEAKKSARWSAAEKKTPRPRHQLEIGGANPLILVLGLSYPGIKAGLNRKR